MAVIGYGQVSCDVDCSTEPEMMQTAGDILRSLEACHIALGVMAGPMPETKAASTPSAAVITVTGILAECIHEVRSLRAGLEQLSNITGRLI